MQNSHTIPIKGALPNAVRTGYDLVIAHRMDKKFASVAKENGVVVEKSNRHLVIKYESGKLDKIQLTTHYGVSNGTVIKNPIYSDYVVDQKVNKGDVVAYNPNFFTRDFFNPTQVLFKYSALVRTTLMESNDTEEDSSAVSLQLATALETVVTKVRTLTIPFNQNVHNLVNVGDELEVDSILCTLEDAMFSDTKWLNSDSVDTLKELAKASPKAKYHGKVTKIEVLYLGDPETATESVKDIIERDNKERAKMARLLSDGRPIDGKLIAPINIEGNTLLPDHMVVKIYIEHPEGFGVGDKLVFSNQLKSVTARVMHGVNETESGLPIHAIFGYQSIANRIVQSAEVMGTTNTLLKLISKEVVDIYRKQVPRK